MSEMDKKRREAIRYLGFGRNAADERTYELIEASFDDLNREASPRLSTAFLIWIIVWMAYCGSGQWKYRVKVC